MLRSSSYRSSKSGYGYGHSNAQAEGGEQEPFFTPQKAEPANKPAFFQAKLTVGGAGDKHEKEADSVANAVVNKKEEAPVIQAQQIGDVQRLATLQDDEKFSTADERANYHREIRTKPDEKKKHSHTKGEEKKEPEVHRSADKEKDKSSDIHRPAASAEDKEKKHAGQRAAGAEKEHQHVHSKNDKTAGVASDAVSERIKKSAGKGSPMSPKVTAEMQKKFHADFSQVRIHTGSEAEHLCHELGAHAFTYGHDIYFNAGKYNPESSEGKQLLAHELTHVVQQGGSLRTKAIQKDDAGTATSPAPSLLEIQGLAMYDLLPALDKLSDDILKNTADGQVAGGPRLVMAMNAVMAKRGKTAQVFISSHAHELDTMPEDQTDNIYDFLKIKRLHPGDVVTVKNKKYVIYADEVRQGGSVAWNCRNPGNIRNGYPYGAFPGKKFHTPKNGSFAIFPTETTGFIGIINVLKDYGHVTILNAMKKYAPSSDSNDPVTYAKYLAKHLGVPASTDVASLSDEQLALLSTEIQKVEGWKPGNSFSRRDPLLPGEVRDH